jgi:hypothetical protein
MHKYNYVIINLLNSSEVTTHGFKWNHIVIIVLFYFIIYIYLSV